MQKKSSESVFFSHLLLTGSAPWAAKRSMTFRIPDLTFEGREKTFQNLPMRFRMTRPAEEFGERGRMVRPCRKPAFRFPNAARTACERFRRIPPAEKYMRDRVLKLLAYFILAIAVVTGEAAFARGVGPVPKLSPRDAAATTQTSAPPPAHTPNPSSAAAAPAAPKKPPAASPAAHRPAPSRFDSPSSVIELQDVLADSNPGVTSNQPWYVFQAVNASNHAVVRVLLAGQPPGIGLSMMPKSARPAVLQVASVDPAVVIEGAKDYGRRAYRVVLPAKTATMLAVRMTGAAEPPSLLAWTEPALAAHNRWMAIFVAAVAGLIAAAAAIVGGVALLSRHAPPRWAALMLASLLLMRLAGFGLFDGSLVTPVGGPYGLLALFAALALATGLRFVDTVLPIKAVWSPAERWRKPILCGAVVVGGLAYLGAPGFTLAIDFVGVLAVLAIAGYVVYCWRKGARAARVLAPGAILFALYGLVSTFATFGGFGHNGLTPDIAGGFLATGAVLLVLTLMAGEGALTFARHPAGPVVPPPPVPHAAIEAIGASFQGVFEIDFVEDKVVLSREAAVLFGLGRRIHNLRMAAWVARIHPDDRPVYEQAIADFRHQTDFAFRIEFRVRDEDGRYLWFELRAAMKGPDKGPAERCVGLIADVTMRKESEAAVMDRTLRDTLTGLGNSVALMEALEALGLGLSRARYALVDIDGFKAVRAAKGDACCDEVLSRLAERLERFVGNGGSVFRVGGNAFAVLTPKASGDPLKFGTELVGVCGEAYRLEGHSIYAPVSVGISEGRSARAPLNLVNNAEVALRFARFKGGAAAVVFTPGMEVMAPSDAADLGAGLYRALDHGEIDVCYQPIVRLSDRSVAGFEAVPQWNHPEKGPISPLDLIAHSEDRDLVAAMGRFTFKRAIGDLAEWQRYFPLVEPLFVCVRFSRRPLRDEALSEFLTTSIKDAGLAPKSLLMELSAADLAAAEDVKRLQALRRAGVGLALRACAFDPATQAVPLQAIKIDKRCLAQRGATADADGQSALSVLVAKAHEAGLRVLAEGVESEDEAERLGRLGAEMAQGFLFAPRLPLQEALAFIAQNYRAADAEVGEN